MNNQEMVSPRQFKIEFKTKAFAIIQDDGGTKRLAVRLKAILTRTDCNMKPGDHDYYNSDLFVGLLNGKYRQIVGTRTYAYLDTLPDGVTVDTSRFLATVSIPIDRNFRLGVRNE